MCRKISPGVYKMWDHHIFQLMSCITMVSGDWWFYPERIDIYENFEPAMLIRINYDIQCYIGKHFYYQIEVRELSTGEYNVIAEHTSLKLQHATGSFVVPDRQYLSGMIYKKFELFLLSNCTSSGLFRMDEPMILERCTAGTHLCELNVYYHIFSEDNALVANKPIQVNPPESIF